MLGVGLYKLIRVYVCMSGHIKLSKNEYTKSREEKFREEKFLFQHAVSEKLDATKIISKISYTRPITSQCSNLLPCLF